MFIWDSSFCLTIMHACRGRKPPSRSALFTLHAPPSAFIQDRIFGSAHLSLSQRSVNISCHLTMESKLPSSSGQRFKLCLWNPEVQCRIREGSPIIHILTRINPVPRINTYFFKIHSNHFLPSLSCRGFYYFLYLFWCGGHWSPMHCDFLRSIVLPRNFRY